MAYRNIERRYRYCKDYVENQYKLGDTAVLIIDGKRYGPLCVEALIAILNNYFGFSNETSLIY